MTAAIVNRRTALVLSACCSAGVFAAFVFLEKPGLGISSFFYLPICLVALATDGFWGALAGIVAAALYAAAVVLDPHIPSRDALTAQTGIRAITFALVGAVVGLYASRNRDLVAKLHDTATTDFVTGVRNVRAFDEELRGRFAARTLFTLVLVDIDELHRVNEVHGHLAGDETLRRVATVLTAVAGGDDLVARVGGDEFAILTARRPDALPDLAAQLNRLLAPDLRVTIAGVGATDAETADDLFKRADDRLFAAKLVRPTRPQLTVVQV